MRRYVKYSCTPFIVSVNERIDLATPREKNSGKFKQYMHAHFPRRSRLRWHFVSRTEQVEPWTHNWSECLGPYIIQAARYLHICLRNVAHCLCWNNNVHNGGGGGGMMCAGEKIATHSRLHAKKKCGTSYREDQKSNERTNEWMKKRRRYNLMGYIQWMHYTYFIYVHARERNLK